MKMLSTGSKMQGFWLQFSENGLDKTPVLKTADTRAQKCTSVYILGLHSCRAHLLLIKTSGIRGGSNY